MFAKPKMKRKMRRKSWRQININYGAICDKTLQRKKKYACTIMQVIKGIYE